MGRREVRRCRRKKGSVEYVGEKREGKHNIQGKKKGTFFLFFLLLTICSSTKMILVGKKRTSACIASKIIGHCGHLLLQCHPVMQDCLHLHNLLTHMCSAKTLLSPVSPHSAQLFCCAVALCWKKGMTGTPQPLLK